MLTDLSCQELVELVTDYLEGDLTPDERAQFETHLVYCRGCWDYLEQMRRTLDLMGELREESLEPDARDGLLAAFRDWKRGSGRGA